MTAQNQVQTSQPEPQGPQIEVLPHPTPPHPASDGAAVENSAGHPVRKVSRNGKIARLPKLERDMVNLMLRNNIPHSNIVDALDEHGIRVTGRNVSNWKTRGGYKEWCLEQDHALQVRLFQDNLSDYLRKHDATEIPEVGLQLAATCISEFLLKPEATQQLATDPEKYSRVLATLCRLTGHIHALQKYRDDSARALGLKHDPERIKRENEEEIEVTRDVYSSAKIGRNIHEPNTPHRNYMPKAP